MEVVIIRPPLVYGPGVKANFRLLMKWVKRGVPLPLGAVHNKRSFVALDNLVSFIIHCMDHPKAANEVFLISDGENASTTELLQKMARALGKRSFLLPVPVGLMTFVAGLLGRKDVANRLFGSLQVDSSKALDLLGWKPVVSLDDALAATASVYLSEKGKYMKRWFDVTITLIVLLVLLAPMLLIAVWVKLTSKGPVFYWSDRVGRHNHIFKMPKFRTLRINTPAVATHLLDDPDHFLTPVGKFLRKSSLDELPQLFSILRGNMSIVGPRPALFNQDDLIELRTQKGIHLLTPGLTGWAQVNGRDELPIPVKVEYDRYYLEHHSFWLDLKIIVQTFFNVVHREGVAH